MQKLKMSFFHLLESLFTCFLKDKTLHNHWDYAGFTVPYYNIPSNNRELQPSQVSYLRMCNYNIPSNNRELQPTGRERFLNSYYNIPSNNRELQPDLVKTGEKEDYNIPSNNRELQHNPSHSYVVSIITYQVITGNYSFIWRNWNHLLIITYQVITGNYSGW